ncbi:putative spore coat protein X/V [Helianthus anomalus]
MNFQELKQMSVCYNEENCRDTTTIKRSRDVKIYSLDAKVGISMKEIKGI